MLRNAVCIALVVTANGHGYQVDPPPRAAGNISGSVAGSTGSCAQGMCFWFNQGCTIGCPNCTGKPDGSCGTSQGKPTLPEYAASYKWYGSPKNQGQAQYPIHEKPAYPEGCGINP